MLNTETMIARQVLGLPACLAEAQGAYVSTGYEMCS